MAQPVIQSVCGSIDPSSAGVTMAHEHLFVDLWPITQDYDHIVDSFALLALELEQFRNAGGGCVIDATSRGIGRNPTGLVELSEATGVHIVMGAGWYREKVYPDNFDQTSTNSLAAELVMEAWWGAEGTQVQPGFIGEIGTERGAITPRQERMFRAAARASHVTGLPILTHTTHWGELGLEQVALLREEGVPPSSIIVGHLGDRFADDVAEPIAQAGVWISIDNLGFVDGYAPLDVRADNVAALWDKGFGGQILLSSDLCALSQMSRYGGPGYANVLERFVPLLEARGFGESEISMMLRANPAKAFEVIHPIDPEPVGADDLVGLIEDIVRNGGVSG